MSKVKEPVRVVIFSGMDAFTGRLFHGGIVDLLKFGTVCVTHRFRKDCSAAPARGEEKLLDADLLARMLTGSTEKKLKKGVLANHIITTCWDEARCLAAVISLESLYGKGLEKLTGRPVDFRIYKLCERVL